MDLRILCGRSMLNSEDCCFMGLCVYWKKSILLKCSVPCSWEHRMVGNCSNAKGLQIKPPTFDCWGLRKRRTTIFLPTKIVLLTYWAKIVFPHLLIPIFNICQSVLFARYSPSDLFQWVPCWITTALISPQSHYIPFISSLHFNKQSLSKGSQIWRFQHGEVDFAISSLLFPGTPQSTKRVFWPLPFTKEDWIRKQIIGFLEPTSLRFLWGVWAEKRPLSKLWSVSCVVELESWRVGKKENSSKRTLDLINCFIVEN
jgi:hypothetical protein